MKNIQFEQDIKEIPPEFQKLKIYTINGESFLAGDLDIIDSNGFIWATFSVEIKGSPDYPKRFPKLFEMGNAFPKILDWHVYEFQDKSCCIDVPESEMIICKNGLNIFDYLKGFAIPYFANQEFRKREGYYLYGEYSHGIFGKVEYFQRKLKAKNKPELILMLRLIASGYNPDRTEFCPFCKKIKFRKCHKKVFNELSQIKQIIELDIVPIFNLFIGFPEYILPQNK